MKRIQLTVIVLAILGLAFAAYARPGFGPGFGPGAQGNCPQFMANGQAGGPGAGMMMGRGMRGGMMGGAGFVAIDEAKAKELFSKYIDENLKGSKLGKIEAVQMPRGTMYTAEVKDSKGNVTFYHLGMRGFVNGPFATNLVPAQQAPKK